MDESDFTFSHCSYYVIPYSQKNCSSRMSFTISCDTFVKYKILFDKLQYLIVDKLLIDLRKCRKNSNGSVLVSIGI